MKITMWVFVVCMIFIFFKLRLGMMEEGLMPYYNSQCNIDAVEEELRLLYIACTRAKEKIHFNDGWWVEGFDRRRMAQKKP